MDNETGGGTMASRRLYRSRGDRIVGGVAGGLGQYFDVDPIIVRLGFVLLGFAGVGVLTYLVLLLAIPKRPDGEPEPEVSGTLGTPRGRQAAAIGLLMGGILLLVGNVGWLDGVYWSRLWWPSVMIAAGALLLLNRRQAHES